MLKRYINNCLDKKFLRDPYNDVNLMKKKVKLGIFGKAEPELSASFPKEDFKSDYTDSPKIWFGTMDPFTVPSAILK